MVVKPLTSRAAVVANTGQPPTIRVRASSWGRLFDCAHSWEGTNLLGMHSPSGLRAHLGTCIHHATALFDAARMPGATPIDAIEAVEAFLVAFDNPAGDVDFTRDNITQREARRIGADLVSLYCREVSPMFRFTAVELKLRPVRISVDRVVIELTGSLDRSRHVAGPTSRCTITADIKSGSNVVDGNGAASIKGRSAQCGTYELLGELQTGDTSIGSQIIALPTNGKARAAVSPVWRAKDVMVGDEATPGLIEVAAGMFSSGLFPPNTQSRLCSDRYCARFSTCRYREPVFP